MRIVNQKKNANQGQDFIVLIGVLIITAALCVAVFKLDYWYKMSIVKDAIRQIEKEDEHHGFD